MAKTMQGRLIVTEGCGYPLVIIEFQHNVFVEALALGLQRRLRHDKRSGLKKKF
jgi:hypothetical protein